MEIIHIVLGKLNPKRLNGVNKVVHQTATQQTLAGKNVSVFGISKTGKNEHQNTPFSLTIFDAFINPFRVDKDLKNAIIAKKDSAVFHIHGSWIPCYFILSRFMAKHRCRFITMQHGGYNTFAMEKGKNKKKLYFQLFEKHLLRNASKVHCIGQSEIEGLSKLGFSEKSILVPYGFEPPKRSEHTSQKKDSVFCYMGRFDIHTKGLDLLIHAFAEVHKIKPKAKLWMIGSGGQINKLKSLIMSLNIEDHVIFWGAIYGEAKFDKMNEATVFVHPSRFEGLPSSVLEAASVGLPIIATKATNMATYIAKNNAGWWIENGNLKSLTNAMLSSISESFTMNKNRGINAFEMIQREFKWSTILLQMDNMYNDVFSK